MRSLLTTALLALFITQSFGQEVVLFGITNYWRFQQTSNLDGVKWTESAFDDSSWPSGPALLYVENNPAVTPRNTPLILGPITYYFRSHFQFTNSIGGLGLVFSNLVDDGAVFYLNGNEVQRLRMPPAPQAIAYGTLATATPPGADATAYDVFAVSGDTLTNLVYGDNVLAVEVHQQTSGNLDIAFGTALSALQSTGAFTFTIQPPNITVLDGRPAQLRVGTSVTPQPALQWYKDGNAIPGAMLSTLTFSSIGPSDAGTYWVVASNASLVLPSDHATITVQQDSLSPAVLRAVAQKDLTNIIIDISEPVRAPATNLANFQITRPDPPFGALTVLSATLSNQSTLYVTTTPRTDRANYNLVLTNIIDLSSASNQVSSAPVPLKYLTSLLRIDTNVTWSYEQSGVCPPVDWMAPTFDDSGWPNGGTVFFASRGGGSPPAAVGTRLQLTNLYGTAQPISYFFRTEFEMPGLSTNALLLRHIIDDGAALYLNNVPLYSIRLGFNAACNALASGSVGSPSYEPPLSQSPFSIGNLASAGMNVIAAEVHQFSANNSDIAFAVSLDGLVDLFIPGINILLPPFATNGIGVLASAGRISVSEPSVSNVVVSLSSSVATALSVPPTVTVLAGDTNAVFDLTVASNTSAMGPQRVFINASAPGFIASPKKVVVLDNIPGTLTLLMQTNIVEGSGSLTGQVQIAAPLSQDITVNLESSTPGAVGVPPAVVIQAGQNSATFLLTIPNNSILEGTRNVTIAAHVKGWPDALVFASVFDKPDSYASLSLATRDIAYDPRTQRIYASVPGSVPTIGNQIVPIAPETGTLEPGFTIGAAPGKVIVVPGGGKLYAAVETNRVKRVDLLSGTTELNFPLDANPGFTLEDFELLPGSPNPVAVLRLVSGFTADVAIYDEGVQRPNVGPGGGDAYQEIIEASADGSSLYFKSFGFQGFRRFSVGSQGLSLVYVDQAVVTSTPMDWRTVGQRMFSSDGTVIDPLIPKRVGSIRNLAANSLLTYDSALQRVFYLTPLSGANWDLRAYEPSSLLQGGALTISNVVGTPSSLIRWGDVGLAFRTDADRVYLIKTSLIQTNPPADIGLTFGVSGAPYFVSSNITESIVITNYGPNAAAEVSWTNTLPPGSSVISANSSAGSVTFSSNTVRGTLASLGPGGSVLVSVVFQPSLPTATLLTATVSSTARETNLSNNFATLPLWIQSGTTPASAILDLVTKDLVRDPVRNRFYASIGNAAPLFPGSVVVIDLDGGEIKALKLGADAGRIAISADGHFLYVGLDDGSGVRRLNLETLTFDLGFLLPNAGTVAEMAVCPTNSRLVAIYRGPDATVTLYEDGVARPNELTGYVGLLAFSDTTGELYTCHSFYSDTPLYRVDYGPSGLSIVDSQPAKPGILSELKFSKGILHYNNGLILNPKTRAVLAQLPLTYNSAVEPDPAANRIYALTVPDSGPGWALRAFDGDQFIDAGSVFATSDVPYDLLRWGRDGLAFRTATQVYLLHSKLVPTNAPTDIALTATVSARSALAGDTIVYNVGITNLGTNTAYGVVLTQAFSLTVTGLVTFVDGGTITNAANFLTWNLPYILPGVGSAMTVSLQSAQDGTLVARAAVRHLANDPKLNNNFGLNVTRIGPSSTNELREIGLTTRELIFDPFRQKIYASVPAREPLIGNSVISIDPTTSRIEPLVFAGSEPDQLCLSDDGRFLYVSLNGRMGARRFDLTGQQPDLAFTFSFTQLFNAHDMKVQPGHPQTLAVSLVEIRGVGPSGSGVFLFDDGVIRSRGDGLSDSIEFAPGGERVYGSGSLLGGSGIGFLRLSVTSPGIAPIDVTETFTGDTALRFENGLIYSGAGRVIDPNIPAVLTTFGLNGPVVPDSQLGRLFQVPLTEPTTELRAYAMGSYQLLGTMPLPNAHPYARHLLRCGGNHLAFRTDPGGQIFLVDTSLAAETDVSPANLSVSQSAFADSPPPGGRVVFNAVMTNSGPGTVSNALLSIRPPVGVESFSVLPSQGTISSAPPGILCNLGVLAAGASAVVQMTATVTNSAFYTNLVSLTSERPDANLADNTAISIIGALYTPPSGATYSLDLAVQDLAYDAVSGKLFASLAGAGTNMVAVLNPASGTIDDYIAVGREPTRLSISFDGQFLYAAVSNGLAITRVHLPSSSVDRSIVLTGDGAFVAMAPLGNAPHTLVVAQGFNAVVAYDDGVPRPNPLVGGYPFSILQSVRGAAQVYAYGAGGHPMVEIYRVSVRSTGLVLTGNSPPDLVFYYNGDMRATSDRLLFGTGQIVDPLNWTLEATLDGGRLVETDPSTSLVFYANHDGQQTATISTWNRFAKQLLDIRTVGGVFGGVGRLVWSGGDRLAFHSSNKVFFIRTPRIQSADLVANIALATNRVVAGADVTISTWASNRGPSIATNSFLTNVLPSNSSFVSATLSQGSVLLASNRVVANLGSIASNGFARLDMRIRFTNAVSGIATNTARVTALTPELFAADNLATLSFKIWADNDHDGLDDDWELEFFHSLSAPNGQPQDDFDGDGISNLQEYLNGTDPTDPLNLLRIMSFSLTNGSLQIQFHGVTGLRYQLEQAAAANGPWNGVGSILLGDGRGLTVAYSVGPNSQFFRVRQVP